MRTFDLTPLYRSAIGFDRLASLLEQRAEPSYPPYNIELVSEDNYRIVMALAGFTRDEVEIVTERDTLHVTGRKQKDETQRTFLHRGIAARQFQRAFVLAEGIEVKGAWLDNGLLHIDLARPQPEVRVRTIQINKSAAAKPVVDATAQIAQGTPERD